MAPPRIIIIPMANIPNYFNTFAKKLTDKCVARFLFGLITIFVLLLILFILQPFQTNIHILLINHNDGPVFTTNNKFLSVAIDSSFIANGFNEINMSLLGILMKPISGGYLRIGGTMADRLYFDKSPDARIFKSYLETLIDGSLCSYEKIECNPRARPNFTMSGAEWRQINKLAVDSDFTILFDLNVLIRNKNGSWNSTNAEELIKYSNERKFNVIWELGNEPNSFKHVFDLPINASQLSNDFKELRNILNKYSQYKTSLIVGPDVTRPLSDQFKAKSEVYLAEFLSANKNIVNAITWHQYYFNGKDARMTYFVNPDIFNALEDEIIKIRKIVELNGYENTPIWLGETSSAYGGGAPGLSNRFISTFIWLDKLGLSAKNGIEVVIRQSLIQGEYSLIGRDYVPNPDWWISVLYKKLVGNRVIPCYYAASKDVRLYCQCTNTNFGFAPAITVFGMNMKPSEAEIRIQGMEDTQDIFAYIVETHFSIVSRLVYLNNDLLVLLPDGSLPIFKPTLLKGDEIILPPYSIGFWVLPNNKFHVCLI